MGLSANAIANIIAGLSLLLSGSLAIFYLRDRRHAKYKIENDYMNSLLKWHSDVVSVLTKLRVMSISEKSSDTSEQLSMLSALIEQGRFFFPNIDRSDGYGKEKPTAYQGYRNLALDFLVATYNIFSGKVSNKKLKQANLLQRHFTSVVFEIVWPKNRLERIRKLTDRYYVQEKSFEDFLEHQDSSAIEYIWHQ